MRIWSFDMTNIYINTPTSTRTKIVRNILKKEETPTKII